MDASGNLYQYDNYDEVAMDTDSEAGSPGEGASFSRSCSLWARPLTSHVGVFQCLRPLGPCCTPEVFLGSLDR